MSKDKKTLQLGMNPSTASGRLVKDTLFKLAVDAGYKCYQCGEDLVRETFSIEHKEPWLDSEDPVNTFFDQDNIAFSHLKCNTRAARTTTKYATEDERLEARRESDRKYKASLNTESRKAKRKAQYKRTGK